ncbi:MAG: phosphatidylglycerophosphatase A [Magnetovibrio sp.]|nr:phosphatidylglycerophosphatase A [Magnetovibrio sp.]
MSKITTKPPRPSLASPGVLLATWFGAGYLPKAPGTWGSLAALPFAWVLVDNIGYTALAAATVVVFVLGLWASKVYMDKTGAHDPGAIVIDEVVGQWIVLLAAPLDLVPYLIGFVLFRFFDVLKPWPISWADKHIGGAWGVMVDDVLAGIAGLAFLYVLYQIGAPYLPRWGG